MFLPKIKHNKRWIFIQEMFLDILYDAFPAASVPPFT